MPFSLWKTKKGIFSNFLFVQNRDFLLFKQVFFAFMNIKPQRGHVWSILIIFDHANLKTCSIIRSRKSKNRSKIYILRTTDWTFVYNPSVWSESSHYIGCSIGVYPLKPIKGVQVEIHPTTGSQQFLSIVLQVMSNPLDPFRNCLLTYLLLLMHFSNDLQCLYFILISFTL